MENGINGETQLFPIIGDPIIYVKSPERLTQGFAVRGFNAICVPMHVRQNDLDAVMRGIASVSNFGGLLITMPHKFAAYRYCSTTSDRAALLKVVSVMRRNADGGWHGDMLDGLAFVKAQKDRGARLIGGNALLLGAGGAGSAIAVALLEAGVRQLTIHDLDASRASRLADLVAGFGTGFVETGSSDPTGHDMVFNATPLGMAETDPLPLDSSLLRASMFVGDVIAGHGETPFVRAAREAGCKTAGGDQMVEAVQDLMLDFMMNTPPAA